MSGVFISYRREDSAGHVGRLYDALSARFGADRVFMDIDHVEAGEDFVEVLNRAVASCRVLLVVIGPRWLSASSPNGRRLDDPNDFVRLEIAAGLSRDVRVIPVLVHGATMPNPSELPPDLAGLARRQAVELADHRWKQDVRALINSLERLASPPARIVRSPAAAKIAAAAVVAIAVMAVILVGWRRLTGPAAATDGRVRAEAQAPPLRSETADTATSTRALIDDDFVSQRRLTTLQTEYLAGPRFCRTAYVEYGFLIEAVHATDACEYVLYEKPFMPNRVRVEVSMRLQRAARGAGSGADAYGIRLIEAQPGDPDSALTYRAAIVGVDNFYVVEEGGVSSRTLLSPNPAAENYIRAGERQTNRWAVEVGGRSLRWLLNDVAIGTVTARVPLSGVVSVYLQGQGLQAVVSHLQIVELPQ